MQNTVCDARILCPAYRSTTRRNSFEFGDGVEKIMETKEMFTTEQARHLMANIPMPLDKEGFGFAYRTRHGLFRFGIFSLSSLLMVSEASLRPCLGMRSVREVVDGLAKRGLKLK